MTNGEKYAGETHNHYVYERICPKCNDFWCGREPSDFRECLNNHCRCVIVLTAKMSHMWQELKKGE